MSKQQNGWNLLHVAGCPSSIYHLSSIFYHLCGEAAVSLDLDLGLDLSVIRKRRDGTK